MQFKRLVDNPPAYTAGKIYSTTVDELEMFRDNYTWGLEQEDYGCFIENDMDSGFYFSRRHKLDKIKFDKLWEVVL